MLPEVELFTDGACSGNPGPGGWAFILRSNGTDRDGWGGARRTTNNRMEMRAVLEGMTAVAEPSRVTLYSDSQYLVKGINEWMKGWKAKGWKRGRNQTLANVDLWKQIDALAQSHRITAVWVRGHDDHPENEACDRMAVRACEDAKVGSVEDDLEPGGGLFS